MILSEPRISINGVELTEGQAMAVRVAIVSFALLQQDDPNDDAHGRRMAAAYSARLREVIAILNA